MWLPDDIDIGIGFPKGPFRIHPDPKRTVGPLLCTYEHGKWWLAHPDGVSPGQLGCAAWVELFEGLQADDTHVLVPVFRYDRADLPCPRAFLGEAVRLARAGWVTIDGIVGEDHCRIVPARQALPDPVGWSRYIFADLVDVAFGGRYIGCWRDIAVHLLGSREFQIHAPRSDFFYWMRKQFDPDDLQLDDERSLDD